MNKPSLWLTLVVGALLLAACSTFTADEPTEPMLDTLAAPAQYVVSTQGRLSARFQATVARNGDTLRHFYPDAGFAVVTTARPDTYRRFASIVERDITVEWIDPGERIEFAADAHNPPFTGDDDFFFDLQWGHDAVNAPEAWIAGQRGAGVRVAVLDGGFDTDHPDLAPNVVLMADMTGQGIDYCPHNPADPFSHGAHTAGTIGAADNAFGTIGVAPEVDLMLVKVLFDVPDPDFPDSCTGTGSFGDVIAGIIFAADNGADVINMSLGASFPKRLDTGPGRLSTAMGHATTYAYQHGVTVIASAGNEATDYDHAADLTHMPSDAPHVLSISATAPIGWATDPADAFFGNLAFYSNFGQSVIDFSAPGGSVEYPGNELCTVAGLTRPCWVFDLVFSTGNGGWYWSAGTSMAAPHAAGVAALVIGANGGDMKPSQVIRDMRERALDLGKPGNDDVHGRGMVSSGY